jgi:DNA-binding transcriptional regulator LsrR (DeoR family)
MTKAKKERRPRRSVTDEERIAMALEKYGPLKRGEPCRELKEIAANYDRDPAVVSKAIKDAFTLGLVDIVRLEDRPRVPVQVPELCVQLEHKFPKLHTALVVDVANRGNLSPDERALVGDKIHEDLGYTAAHYVSNSALVHDGDVIGIGGGRGVFSFLKALTFFRRLKAQNVSAISLAGDVYARTHSWWREGVTRLSYPGLNFQLDPDDHLNLLGFSFSAPLNMRKISRSIAWERGEVTKMIKETVLDRDEWKKTIPTLGIVGVGVLSEGHRFYQEVKRPEVQREHMLKPILGDLHRLIEMMSGLEFPKDYYWYVPVGDICNRLFYVRPPAEVKISKEQERQICELIARLNEKLLTATEDQLGQIKQLILVAGTLMKALAIKQLLEEDKVHIRILCVDKEVAEEILGIRQKPRVPAQ